MLTGTLILAASPFLSDLPGGAASLGMAWLAPAAHAAETVRVTNIRISNNSLVFEIPEATIEGTRLTQQELQSLFAADGAGSLAGLSVPERLEKLSASRITIPEFVVSSKVGEQTEVTRYTDVDLRNIASGIVDRATIQRSAGTQTVNVKSENGAGSTRSAYSARSGEMTIDTTDLVFIARLLAGMETAPAGERETRLIHGAYTINDYHVTAEIEDKADNEAGDKPTSVTVTLDKIAGKGVSARLPHTPMLSFFHILEENPDNLDDLPADKARVLFSGAADLLSSFDLDETSITNMNVSSKAADGSEFAVRFDTIDFSYIDQKLHLAFDGVAATGRSQKETEPNTFSIKRIAVEDLSFQSTIAAFGKAAELVGTPGFKPEGAAFAPTGGLLKLADVDVDFDVSDDEDGSEPNRVTFSLKAFETTTGGNVVNGRQRFETVLDDLAITLPEAGSEADSFDTLRALGYDQLTLSANLRGEWDPETKNLSVDSVSFSGIEVGSFAASARLGNVGSEVYSGDVAAALEAIAQASLHTLTVKLEDEGLVERLVKQQTADSGASGEEVRQQYAALATVGIPALIGDTPAARKIASAISQFATKPGTLTISATARDPAGVLLSTLSADTPPAELLKQFDITASN